MKPHELAWKGTTIEQKRQLLEHSQRERDRLVTEGKAKDGFLGLASTCVDIIGTAHAAISDADKRNDTTVHKADWQKLLDEALAISKEAVDLALKENMSNWMASDYEVAGIIILYTSKGDVQELVRARNFLEMGIDRANELDNVTACALLFGQLIRQSIAAHDEKILKIDLDKLVELIKMMGEIPPEVSTRLHRALAEGHKFLYEKHKSFAVQIATDAGLDNQVFKAKQI